MPQTSTIIWFSRQTVHTCPVLFEFSMEAYIDEARMCPNLLYTGFTYRIGNI